MLDAGGAYDAQVTAQDATADRGGDAQNDGTAPDVCVPNACGGCVVLSAKPGTACGQCGKYACGGAGGEVMCVDPGYVRASAIAAGDAHVCILTTAHGVRCWGWNVGGQLGDGTFADRSTPPATDVLTPVKAIATGGNTTCALTTAGGVRCWGSNGAGQLGDNFMENWRATPPPMDVLTGVRVIAEGHGHTCAVTTADGARCWGSDVDGELGDGAGSGFVSVPPATDVLTGVGSIAAGYFHTCALTTAGGVRCWGDNTFGQLGDGTTVSRSTPPATDAFAGARAVALGAGHSCALTTAGGVRCWGDNTFGQLGDGTTTDRATPPVADVLQDVQAFAAGGYFACALTMAGGVRCWGDNTWGQLGDGTATDRATPPVADVLQNVQAIAAGDYFACALTTAGGVRCWGDNRYGQLGDGTTVSRSNPPASDIAIPGLDHVCP
jgi:alpha-tubulin suppressor-like RCC1 family protein